nr:MAG TPA: hypothetical protein [Caudoviricetes sp.]
MHRTTRVCDGANFICIKLFPINGLSFTIVFVCAKYKREDVSSTI